MGQAATSTTDTHPVSLEALRFQLKEKGRVYCDNRKRIPEEAHDQLLHTLRNNDCREIMTTVVDGDYIASAFVRSGFTNHIDILEAFLNHGMKIDTKDNGGWTALIHACGNEHEECVRFLLDHNTSVDFQNWRGFTALMQASMNGFTKIVEMLLEKNALPDLQDISGRTAFMYASEYDRKEIVQLLLNRGADFDLKNKDGETALDLAANKEIEEMIRNHVNTTGYVLK